MLSPSETPSSLSKEEFIKQYGLTDTHDYESIRSEFDLKQIEKKHRLYWKEAALNNKLQSLNNLDRQLSELKGVHPLVKNTIKMLTGYGSCSAKAVFVLKSPGFTDIEKSACYSDATSMMIVRKACAELGAENCYFMYIFPFLTKEEKKSETEKEEDNHFDGYYEDNNNNNEGKKFWNSSSYGRGQYKKKKVSYVDMDISESDRDFFYFYASKRISIIKPKYVMGFGAEVCKILVSGFNNRKIGYSPGRFSDFLDKYQSAFSVSISSEVKVGVLVCPHPYHFMNPPHLSTNRFSIRNSNSSNNNAKDPQKVYEEYKKNVEIWERCFSIMKRGLPNLGDHNDDYNSSNKRNQIDSFKCMKEGVKETYTSMDGKKKKKVASKKPKLDLKKNQPEINFFASKIDNTTTGIEEKFQRERERMEKEKEEKEKMNKDKKEKKTPKKKIIKKKKSSNSDSSVAVIKMSDLLQNQEDENEQEGEEEELSSILMNIKKEEEQ